MTLLQAEESNPSARCNSGDTRTMIEVFHLPHGFTNPIAIAEYWIRGKNSQVVIEYNGARGGQPLYGYGPFE